MLSNIIALLIIFTLGFVLKELKVFSDKDASLFLKFVFFISAPSLILYSFPKITFQLRDLYLSIISPSIVLIMFCASMLIARLLRIKSKYGKKTEGTFLTGSMIMNTSLLVAVAFTIFDKLGVVKAQMFDLGNAIMVFSFVYFISSYYGSHGKVSDSIKKMLASPPLWAVLIGLSMNFLSLKFPANVDNTFRLLGLTLTPLVLFSLGVYLDLKFDKFVLTVIASILRVFFGLSLGFLFVYLFKLSGPDKLIVLLGSAAPAGYNTLVFSSINKLDEKFASSFVSLTLLLNLILIPVLINLLG